ncbi:MAG TPA: hypothetical protein VJT31_04550 [Rugosimonospora sp.]|nr:hypothetical protein [Rugosimonospora sp.]
MSEIAPAARRPAAVTAAGFLLFGTAVLAVVIALLPLPYAGAASTAAKSAYAKIENGDGIATAVSATIYVTVLIFILAGITLAIFGVFNLRGSNGVRIATWVVGGVGVLCCGSSVLIGRLASGLGQNANTPDMQAAQKQVQAAYPSWYAGVQAGLTIVALLALIAVIILLALPAANGYFRRPKTGVAEVGLPYPYSGEPPLPPVPPVPPAQRDE